MYRLAQFGLILSAAALSCWPAPILAGPPEHSYRDSALGEVTYLALIDPNPTGPTFYQEYEGTGVANPLGRYNFAGSHILKFEPPPGIGEEGAHGSVLGEFTTTTPDGSTITGTYAGTFRRVEGVVRFDLTVLFGEGTGRLDGVTGEAVTSVIATGASPGNPFTWTSEGFLTFP